MASLILIVKSYQSNSLQNEHRLPLLQICQTFSLMHVFKDLSIKVTQCGKIQATCSVISLENKCLDI